MHRMLLAFCITCLGAAACPAEDRPNIVFAFADDLGKYASAYRDATAPSPNDLIETPNFDRIAREGALFHNAFAASPSCTPSRAAIVAGRHFFRNGSHSQLHHPWMKGFADPWDEVRGFPLMLQEAGYHIGWSYKLHISEDRLGGKQRNYVSAGRRFNSFSQNVMNADDRGAEKQKLLEEVRGNFRALLADRGKEQPFYSWFNPPNPHRAWAQGSGKAIWGIDPEGLAGKLPPFLHDNETVREDFADYLGEGMAFDAAVGVLLEELERLGEVDNTLVVVIGNQGATGFARGKCNLYDFGSGVLLAARWPARLKAAGSVETPVSLIDLAPTFLAAAGLQPSADMNGQNLLPALAGDTADPEAAFRGWALTGRETHVNEAREGNLPYPMRAIRTGEYLYIVNFKPDRWPVAVPPLGGEANAKRRMDIDYGPTRDWFTAHETDPKYAQFWKLGFDRRPAEELYNVQKDPHQMHNLAGEAEHDAVRRDLREKLFAELRENNDPRVAGEGDAFDRPPYAPFK